MQTTLVENPYVLNSKVLSYIIENLEAMLVWGRVFLFALWKCILTSF